MGNKIYIYSNSTRETKRKFSQYYFENTSKHVFINDCQPIIQNKELFNQVTYKMLVIAFDSWSYIHNLKSIFDNNITFNKIITCNTSQYCNVDPITLVYTSVDGKIQHNFNGIEYNLTTGARAFLICKQLFPTDTIVLVNFSDKSDPTYGKCKTHNVIFEEKLFSNVERLSL